MFRRDAPDCNGRGRDLNGSDGGITEQVVLHAPHHMSADSAEPAATGSVASAATTR
jgi:hypothetical protein